MRFSWVLLYSSGLIVYVGRYPPYLLGLGFHADIADADAAGTYYLFRKKKFRMLLPFFHTRKVSERDPLRSLPKDVCLYYPRRNHV